MLRHFPCGEQFSKVEQSGSEIKYDEEENPLNFKMLLPWIGLQTSPLPTNPDRQIQA